MLPTQTRKAYSPYIQEVNRPARREKLLIHQKIFPKRPYRAKYAYFNKIKATIEIIKVSNSSDACTSPNFQPKLTTLQTRLKSSTSLTIPFSWLPHDHFLTLLVECRHKKWHNTHQRSFWSAVSLFRKWHAPIADANPMALRIAKTALMALLLLLNCNEVRILKIQNAIRTYLARDTRKTKDQDT